VEHESILTTEAAALLESPCSLIVGTVDPDGRPEAARGWSLHLTEGHGRARLLLSAAAPRTRDNLERTRVIAVTGTDVPTNVSVQVKGRALALEPETDADRERRTAYLDRFLGIVAETDGSPIALLRRLEPREFYAVVLSIDAAYDQTPGPRAGRSLLETDAR
jgi:hypothetical protein